METARTSRSSWPTDRLAHGQQCIWWLAPPACEPVHGSSAKLGCPLHARRHLHRRTHGTSPFVGAADWQACPALACGLPKCGRRAASGAVPEEATCQRGARKSDGEVSGASGAWVRLEARATPKVRTLLRGRELSRANDCNCNCNCNLVNPIPSSNEFACYICPTATRVPFLSGAAEGKAAQSAVGERQQTTEARNGKGNLLCRCRR